MSASFSPTQSLLEGRSQGGLSKEEHGLKMHSDENQTDPAKPPRVTVAPIQILATCPSHHLLSPLVLTSSRDRLTTRPWNLLPLYEA